MHLVQNVRDRAALEARRWLDAPASVRYLTAVLLAAAATAARLVLVAVGLDTFYLLLLPTVLLAALLGGFGPGVLATAAVTLAVAVPADPVGRLAADDASGTARLLLFVVDGVVIAALAWTVRTTFERMLVARDQAIAARDRTSLLQDLTAALSSELEPEGIASIVLARSSSLFAADHAAVVVSDERGVRTLAARGYDVRAPDPRAVPRTPIGTVLTEGGELWIEDADAFEAAFPAFRAATGTPSSALAVLALRSRAGRTFGALLFGWTGARRFTAENQDLERAIARITEQALERAALFEEQAARVADLSARAEMREAFMAVLSHELKTPVTTIFGNASILARSPDRPDIVERVTDIEEEAERLRRIVDDLLVLSRAERGAVEIAPEPLLLQHEVAEIVADLGRKHEGTELRFVCPRDLPPVLADPTALRQIVHNLVTNAIKYGGSGPVTVSAHRRDADVEVEVLDRGPGVGPHPERLFGLFYRAPHSSRLAAGTGIGLYVAMQLVEAMGGAIEASERDGGGARFAFGLPIATDDADDDRPRAWDGSSEGVGAQT